MRYAWVDNGHGRQTYRRIDKEAPQSRSHLPVPGIISDTMDEVEHPCDGKHYSSKSAFRRVTRANGCIEVGNDAQRFKSPKRGTDDKGIELAVDKAIARLNA
jgi:hypothetical protein